MAENFFFPLIEMTSATRNPRPASRRRSAIHNLNVPIFLTGFMGCGKSSVGLVLADLLERPFIDLDARIEARTNRSIPDIIQHDGEEKFREIESEALREAVQMRVTVIALGGGAITRAENRELIAREGISIWLDAPFELCWQRIQQDKNVRPLAPDEATARARFESRLPLYQQATFHIQITSEMLPADISSHILSLLPV